MNETFADRQRALEAQGWRFERRNSKKQWVKIKPNSANRNRQLQKAIQTAEKSYEPTA